MSHQQVFSSTELNTKIERIHRLLEQHKLEGLLLRRVSNFAWATCGADSHVNTATSEGIASLLITSSNRYLITNNIEAARLETEEKLSEQNWELHVYPWYLEKDPLAELTDGMKLGTDSPFPGGIDLSNELSWLRSQLTDVEGTRYKSLGILCAEAMQQAINAVRPGMTEFEIAGLLSEAAESKGIQAIVNLIATDERIFSYRHPLPTSKKLQRYAMLVLCGRKWGLICSITRLIHFGPLPDEVRHKAKAVAQIDAAMIAATCPGRTISDVFLDAQKAYASTGFPDEWQLHHQGGSAGYEPREIVATPTSTQPILAGQVFAWNPSITGVKSEDTILVGEQSNEILTEMSDWPTLEVQIGDQIIKRPAILEIE